MKNITETPDTTPVEVIPANRFTPVAQEWSARLRELGNAFPADSEPRLLTRSELVLARKTSIQAMENAAAFLEANPSLVEMLGDPQSLRESIGYEIAFGSVLNEAKALVRRIEMTILRFKLKPAKVTRGVYRVAKGVATVDAGDVIRTHVQDMKRTLVPRRKKVAPATETEKK